MAELFASSSQNTKEQEFAANRQMFLTQQGYNYEIRFEELDEKANAAE